MSNHSIGPLGQGITPKGVETQLFRYYTHGAFLADGTTGPAQLTGTGNGTFYYDNTAGIVVIDGTAKDVPAAADTLLETAGDILDSGESKVYLWIAWKHPSTGAITLKMVGGTPATTGSQVAPTEAEVEAGLPAGAKWIALGSTTINRTADTTATQTGTTNTIRPLLLPSVHYPS